ncbi:MAG: NAD-dependent epimerase/dehydratase family protein [Bradyrhizobium sp.]|nr:NAD-dependent epimerase/dehydratase family protein [Bradyrhizobium sp.]
MTGKIVVLVTGSDGFIGRHLVPYLAQRGYRVIAASRIAARFENPDIAGVVLPDLSRPFDWQPLLRQCDVVVHLAGIAHRTVPDELHDRVNHLATAELARAAVCCNTKHLILISSIAAQSGVSSDRELTEDVAPQPVNAYGRSKLAAERAVRAAGVPFTILRPVAIYGDGEKGNFATLHKIARLPVPLPIGALTARRSILSIENFCSAIKAVMINPSMRGETFILSDPISVTVPDLVARYRISLGRSPGLIPMPEKWLERSLKLVGQSAIWERLGRQLVASPAKLIAMGWNPGPPSATARPTKA